MSNEISIVKNVLDKQQHKDSVSNGISLNPKQKKVVGITKNQEKVLIIETTISDFKNLKENFQKSDSSYKEESESEENMPIGDHLDNVI